MTNAELDAILTSCTYPGYVWQFREVPGGGFLVWAMFWAPCTVKGGEPVMWTTRKWFVSQHSCRSEVVGTLFKLVLTSIEHEARELFKVDGTPVYDPHLSVDALASIAGQHEVRSAPPKVAA